MAVLSAMALRNGAIPVIGAYWLWPCCMASCTAWINVGSQSKSGKPWPKLTAPCLAANADITVKMVVPTAGRREGKVIILGAGEVALAWFGVVSGHLRGWMRDFRIG